MEDEEMMTMAEARALLRVGKPTMKKIVAREQLRIYRNPRDERERLLLKSDVERLLRPVEAVT